MITESNHSAWRNHQNKNIRWFPPTIIETKKYNEKTAGDKESHLLLFEVMLWWSWFEWTISSRRTNKKITQNIENRRFLNDCNYIQLYLECSNYISASVQNQICSLRAKVLYSLLHVRSNNWCNVHQPLKKKKTSRHTFDFFSHT